MAVAATLSLPLSAMACGSEAPCMVAGGEYRIALPPNVQDGQKTGEVKADIDLKAFSHMCIGMLRGVGSLHMMDKTVDIDAAYDMITSTCTQVLSAQT